ncbi:MAG: hypothetical protein AAB590_00505 [Patescibacteria group bacterium]
MGRQRPELTLDDALANAIEDIAYDTIGKRHKPNAPKKVTSKLKRRKRKETKLSKVSIEDIYCGTRYDG